MCVCVCVTFSDHRCQTLKNTPKHLNGYTEGR